MKLKNAAKRCLLLLLTAFPVACAPARSDRVSHAVQPTLFQYSREVQAQGANEFDALAPACPRDELVPGCSVLRTFTKDYGTNRNEIRSIKKLPNKPAPETADRA